MSNTDIPSFNDICGTITEALAETILNREAVIAQLRDELARTKDLLRERSTNYGELAKQNAELRNQIEEDCESHDRDLKELHRLQEAIRPLKTENIRLTAQRDQLKADNERLKAELANSSQDFGRGDAYWTAIKERDDARREYCEYVAEDRRQGLVGHEDCTPDAVAMDMGWSVFASDTHTPSIFEPRRTRRSDFTQQQSDSDPVTGVQYGDLT